MEAVGNSVMSHLSEGVTAASLSENIACVLLIFNMEFPVERLSFAFAFKCIVVHCAAFASKPGLFDLNHDLNHSTTKSLIYDFFSDFFNR